MEGSEFPFDQKDLKKFAQNENIIVLNILFTSEKEIEINQVYKTKYQFTREINYLHQ